MGSDETVLDHSPEAMTGGGAAISEYAKDTAAVSPTESEIAAVAHQLWLANGCPAGSDQEDWFQAEAILKKTPGTKSEDLLRGASEIVIEYRWRGHWEAWEMEWGEARWIWD
jgi:Protein of unknown function (DUF2934)